MEEVVFNYRNRQAQAVNMNVSTVDLKKFESDYLSKIVNKFNNKLISPKVEVVVSNDGNTILDCHLVVDGLLN